MSTIYEVLAKAQAEFPPIPKNSDGQVGSQKYKYADLLDVIKIVTPVLSKHGLAVFQTGTVIDGRQALTTTVAHATGTITGSFLMPTVDDPQRFGKALTYYRRYALCAILGVVADDDTDGDLGPKVKPEKQAVEKPAGAQAAAPKKPDGEFWKIPFGPHRGKNLYEMPLKDSKAYANELIKDAAKTKLPLNGAARELVNRVKAAAGLPAT